jgi:hypothetical protein
MDPSRWARIKDLFHAALARPPGVRETFLRESTGADEDLRRAVRVMLARQPSAERFLESSALHVVAMALAAELERGEPGDVLPPPTCAR